jgi:hypothetical protein
MVGALMRQAAPHDEGWDKAALRGAILRLARIFALATLALWATRTFGAELGVTPASQPPVHRCP